MRQPNYIFGPVPSRRLGFSLGVDLIPYKTCTLDCVYCQLGKTTNKSEKSGDYVTSKDILDELRDVLSQEQKIDYITLSGSGEPTLNSNIGDIIKGIKGITSAPIAVITNGTLLYQRHIREALCQADLVIPSLDAVTQEVFERVNRPYGTLSVDQVIEGIKSFSKEYKGEVWLEVMAVKGINDHGDEVTKMKRIISEINPHKIQLNTVIRPPAESSAKGLSPKELERIRNTLGEKCCVIQEFQKEGLETYAKDTRTAILNLTERRGVTILDVSNALGIHRNEAVKLLEDLRKEKVIRAVFHDGQSYYKRMDES